MMMGVGDDGCVMMGRPKKTLKMGHVYFRMGYVLGLSPCEE
jgi:hypothetical protein